MNLILAVPAALPNDLSSETSGEHPRPKLDNRTVEGLLLSRNAQGYWITLNTVEEDLGLPPGILKAFFCQRNTTGPTLMCKETDRCIAFAGNVKPQPENDRMEVLPRVQRVQADKISSSHGTSSANEHGLSSEHPPACTQHHGTVTEAPGCHTEHLSG